MTTALRIVSGALAGVFAVSSAVQWNDPDPLRWLLLYAAAAVLSGVAVTRRVAPLLLIGLALVALGWAAWLAPGVLRAAAFTGNEEERELGGLLLVAIWMLVLWRAGARSQGDSAGP